MTGWSKKQTIVTVLLVPLVSACKGVQSSLDPQGPQASAVANIAWWMFGGAAVILLLVMALALYAVFRAPGKRRAPSSTLLIVTGGVMFPVVTLTVLLAYGTIVMGDARQAETYDASGVPDIEVISNRWWWDVHYRAADGSVVTGANEIRIPAGVPVKVLLRSNDVIHSFWVPNLTGKMDLIPGRTNRIVLHADAPGHFRGQCAEFCGAQHARMAFQVIAETPAQHAAWLKEQSEPAPMPDDPLLLRGREAFLANQCASCHTIRGVSEASQRGPDLSRIGGRRFIAAGTLENSRDNLAVFIRDSQSVKPGSSMPAYSDLDADTLHALAAYLESLQ